MSDIELIQQPPKHFVGIRRKVPIGDLAGFFSEAFPKVTRWLDGHGVPRQSAPMALWCGMDMEAGIADTHAGCFVQSAIEVDGEITAGTTEGGDTLKLVHRGGYDTMGQSWQRIFQRAKELDRPPGTGWEIYVDDPTLVEPNLVRTEIYLPLK
jgi:effector-binding domain-containing protein